MRAILLGLIVFFLVTPDGLRAGDPAGDELAEFTRSRPAAGMVLRETPEVVEFLRAAFRGAYTSVPLNWDAQEPQGNAYAENTPSDEGGCILVRVSSRLSPVDQVAALVYECRNAQNEKQFARRIREAYLGGVSKQEFIQEILRLEHGKMKETRAFLAPLRTFRDLDVAETDFYRKMLGTPEEFEAFLDYLHRIKRPDYDVFAMYSKFYDFLTITPERRKAELDASNRDAAAADAVSRSEGSAVGASDSPVSGQSTKRPGGSS